MARSRTAAELRLMTGAPPFAEPSQVSLANWQDPPFNRWSFQHVRDLVPTARIRRGDGPVLAISPRRARPVPHPLPERGTGADRRRPARPDVDRRLHRVAPRPHRHRAVLQRHDARHAAPADVGLEVGDVDGGRHRRGTGRARRLRARDLRRPGARRDLIRRRDRAAAPGHAHRHALRRDVRRPDGRRAALRAGLPVAAARRRRLPDGRHRATSRRCATTASTVVRSVPLDPDRRARVGGGARGRRAARRADLAGAVAADGRGVRRRDHRRRPRQPDGRRRYLRDAARPGPVRAAVRRSGAAADGSRSSRAAWIEDTIRGAPDGAKAFADGLDPEGWARRPLPNTTTGTSGGSYDPGALLLRRSASTADGVYVHVPMQTVVVGSSRRGPTRGSRASSASPSWASWRSPKDFGAARTPRSTRPANTASGSPRCSARAPGTGTCPSPHRGRTSTHRRSFRSASHDAPRHPAV